MCKGLIIMSIEAATLENNLAVLKISLKIILPNEAENQPAPNIGLV